MAAMGCGPLLWVSTSDLPRYYTTELKVWETMGDGCRGWNTEGFGKVLRLGPQWRRIWLSWKILPYEWVKMYFLLKDRDFFSCHLRDFSGVIFRKNPDPSGWNRIDGLNPIQMEKDFRGSPFCRTYLDPLGLAASTICWRGIPYTLVLSSISRLDLNWRILEKDGKTSVLFEWMEIPSPKPIPSMYGMPTFTAKNSKHR